MKYRVKIDVVVDVRESFNGEPFSEYTGEIKSPFIRVRNNSEMDVLEDAISRLIYCNTKMPLSKDIIQITEVKE